MKHCHPFNSGHTRCRDVTVCLYYATQVDKISHLFSSLLYVCLPVSKPPLHEQQQQQKLLLLLEVKKKTWNANKEMNIYSISEHRKNHYLKISAQ